MTSLLDLSADFADVADAVEAVTLRARGSSPESPGTPIAHALRRAVTTREAAVSSGRYTASDVTWHLPVAEVPVAPRLGDVLCDAGGCAWTVLEVAQTTLASRWRVTSRSLAVIYALDDVISILQATFAKGDGGAAEPTWTPWMSDLRARIQPLALEIDDEYEARVATTRVRIFLAESLVLNETHRVRGSDGTIYKVLGMTAAERIDELSCIDAEVTPWP